MIAGIMADDRRDRGSRLASSMSSFRFSLRSSMDLAPNRLSVALSRARASSRPLLDLTESNPTRASIPYETRAVLDALALPASLQYEPAAFGIEPAREVVARELSANGARVDPSRVVLTASTSEAYAFLFKLLADPGDEILVPAPSYPLFDHLARFESVRPVPYRLAYDGAWHFDLASVRQAISPRTRALVVVNPNNPTGSYVKKEELDALASLDLPLVSDEVFSRFPLREDASRVTTVLQRDGGALVFSLGGLSKLAALPQVKLGWIAVAGHDVHAQAALARLEVIADAFLSVSTPVQHALPALLASRTTPARAIADRTRANLAHLGDVVRGSAASLLDVEGGWYATLRLPRTQSEEQWVTTLLEQDGVYVHPGHFFDFSEEAFIVVSLLTQEETLGEGARRIIHRVNTHG
jgi:aspartate/methionine/tyrosine aminotransferase